MKHLAEAFRGAKKTEILIILVMLCVLLVLSTGGDKTTAPGADPEEERLERILSRIEGAGKVSVMLSRNAEGIQGCVAVSSGAGDMHVMLEIQRSVRTLTGLDLDSIEILKSER